jgi:hypothetical protein
MKGHTGLFPFHSVDTSELNGPGGSGNIFVMFQSGLGGVSLLSSNMKVIYIVKHY